MYLSQRCTFLSPTLIRSQSLVTRLRLSASSATARTGPRAIYRSVETTSTSIDSGSESALDPTPQTSEVGGHRTKRIKTEDTTDCTALYEPEASDHAPSSEPQLPDDRGKQEANAMGVDQANKDRDRQGEADALLSDTGESASESYQGLPDLSLPSRSAETSPNNSRHITTGTEKDVRSRSQTSGPEIDLSSAPSDPTELAIWVAKQISNFRDEGRDSMDMDEDEERRKLMLHPPGMFNRRFDEDNDPIKVAERERVREENRARKKKWRESNTERSKESGYARDLFT